jgi:uroporphyrinogen decarboxylase
MRVFEDYQIRFGLDQIQAGADAIWLGDCNASGHLISPDAYRDFAMEPASRVAEAYKDAGGIVFYHASEELPALIDLQAGAGFSILSVGPGVDIGQARDVVKGRVCLSGNVNPLTIIERGAPDDVRAEVERIVDQVSRHGGHVMNSGEMVPRDTPEDNVRAYVAATRTAWSRTRG